MLGRAHSLVHRYQNLLRQGGWVVLGQGLTGAFTLAGTRLITQFVAPDVYGIVNLLQNSLVLLRTLFCSPTLNAALRYYPDAEREHYVTTLRQWLQRSLAVSVLAMELIIVVIAFVWARGEPQYSLVLLLSVGLYAAADVGRTFETTLLNAARRQQPAAILSIAETLLRPMLIVAGVYLIGARVDVVMGALAATVGMTYLIVVATLERITPESTAPLPAGLASEMLRYALPLIPIAFMNWVTAVSDRYCIAWISHDTAGVGIYAAGYGLISQPFLLLHGVVALTLRPAYFSAVAHGAHQRAAQMFRIWLALSTAGCLGGAVAVYALRGVLVGIFLGPRYQPAANYLPWIGLGYLFYVLEQVLEQHLLAYKRTRAVLLAQTCGAVASVLVTIPLVLRYGAVGAAYACPVYFGLQCAVAALLVTAAGRQGNGDGSERRAGSPAGGELSAAS